jgi:starvation-inducible DNA-binding protein
MGDCVDDLGERVVQLGGTAHGTARQVAKRSTLPGYPAVTAWRDHAEAVAAALAAFGKLAPAGIDQADELGDQDRSASPVTRYSTLPAAAQPRR